MKRMILILTTLGFFAFGAGNALAGYGHYFSPEFKNSALRLDQSGKGFAQQVAYRYGQYSQEYRLAADFSRGASHYCDLVARGRDLGRLREVFNELQRRYYRIEQFATRSSGHHGRGYRNDGDGFYRLSSSFNTAAQALRYELASYGQYGGYKKYGYGHSQYGQYGYGRQGYGQKGNAQYYDYKTQPQYGTQYGTDYGYRNDDDYQRQR